MRFVASFVPRSVRRVPAADFWYHTNAMFSSFFRVNQTGHLTVELSGAAMIDPNGGEPKRLRQIPTSYRAA